MNAVGIDVGAASIHAVALDRDSIVVAGGRFSASELSRVAEWSRQAEAVAVDAPAEISTAPHRGDASLKPKFRVARCAEIALGRLYGIWVPWVAPLVRPSGGWIAVGLDLYERLRAERVRAIEVFPHAAFRALAGAAIPPKTRAEGLAARIALLARAGVRDASLPLWSHDGLDALVSAVVALDFLEQRAERVTCGHDGSAIWLPGRR